MKPLVTSLRLKTFARLVLVLSALAPNAISKTSTWHVNNLLGDDKHDGTSEQQAFRTLARAVKAAQTSDVISLANTGQAYREPLVLSRTGGTPSEPMVIEGNGAVISGLREIDSNRWKKNGEVYEITGPQPYGFPMLIIDGQRSLPGKPGALEPGQWSWTREADGKRTGVLRFRPEAGKKPDDYQLEGTFESSGLQVGSSSYLVVRNLVSEFHSNDGFNIHGDCRSCVFENIEGRFNGDDGFSIHEAIEAVVRNGHFHHNGSGIEDVNLSRSFYSGIRVHDNRKLGVLFIGAFHSAVDARVYDNPSNFRITPGTTRHLVGGEFSPIQGTSVYLQNVTCHGGDYGAFITDRARVMIVSSIFADSKIGIAAEPGSQVHLTKSVVANCGELELQLQGQGFFGDVNIYFPGRYEVDGKVFSADQWDRFKKAVGHHGEALQQNPVLNSNFQIEDPVSQKIGKHKLGPTAHYGELDS
jgi:hypothetical protein